MHIRYHTNLHSQVRDVEEAQDKPAQNENTPVSTDKDTTEVAPEVDLDDLAKEESSISPWKKVEVDSNLGQIDKKLYNIFFKNDELVDREKNIVTRDDCNEGYLYGMLIVEEAQDKPAQNENTPVSTEVAK
ncbi:hypothetical protein HCN44_010676 [Aphidius gifuensis]|uniref:Uncharacterized protein n=1 Tax=Aphidius gifuensis TaxID=684658 RepID=A0A834XR18_APHGI|nr:hypothetical protein HCN44_010676 [Aphidius gifuensis]